MALASEKLELSNVEILSRIKVTEKIQGKWFQLAVSSCYPSSSYTYCLGILQYFLSLFAIDQLRKIKFHRMQTDSLLP